MNQSTSTWRKSSYSGAENACVELRNTWYKSSYSTAENACVELRNSPVVTEIRDTKDRQLGSLQFSDAAFGAFLNDVKATRVVPPLGLA